MNDVAVLQKVEALAKPRFLFAPGAPAPHSGQVGQSRTW